MFMMDECVGHMTERVVIPEPEEIEVEPRRFTKLPPAEYLPYKADNGIPEMVKAGDGYRFHITGLTHDERGYPVMSADCQAKMLARMRSKIDNNLQDILLYEEEETSGADVVVVAYGITSRVALPAIRKARREGLKVGFIRLIVVWPFPEERIRTLSSAVGAFVVPEINLGQMVLEVDRHAKGGAKVYGVPHAGGSVHDPEEIYKVIKNALQ
jgi:2-oxoglutarate ferredoxin oxidoreductase subunit alpha